MGLIPGLGRCPRGEMVTHSSILAQKIPWTEEPGRLHTVHEVAKSRTRLKQLSTHTWLPLPSVQSPPRCALEGCRPFSSFLKAHFLGSVSHAGVGRTSASESLILTEHAGSCMDQNFLEFWILRFKYASK